MPFLADFVVVFGAALVVTALSARVSLPPLIGFLLTGMLVGPHGLALISDVHTVEMLAELGVVFLLFAIGLELPMERLARLGRFMVLGGSAQAFTTGVLAALAIVAAGYGAAEASFYGMVIALSSTAIVLRTYFARRELSTLHGRMVTGVLLFQDMLIVPAILAVPILAGAVELSAGSLTYRFGGGLAAVGVAFVIGRLAIPRVMHLIAATRVSELMTVAALFAGMGGALATDAIGFSYALGGFIAGILLAESDYHHQIAAETGPFRDILSSFFFVAVGMLLDLRFVGDNLLAVFGLALAVMAGKAIIAGGATRLFGFGLRTCILAGVGLSQVGEFSLILARSGYELQLVDDWHYQLVIAVSVLTMILTPGLIALVPRLLAGRVEGASGEGAEVESTLSDHVVICGYGPTGANLVQVLREGSIPHQVVDANPLAVRTAREEGVSIMFGDCTSPEILRQAGVPRARIFIVAVSDSEATALAVAHARRMNPSLTIIARARQVARIELLQRRGADIVVSEELEASVAILVEVMRALHLPGNLVRTQARILREDGYKLLRAPSEGASEAVRQALVTGTSDTFWLRDGHPLAGKTLRDLELRNKTGATVLAIVRDDQQITPPSADDPLRDGDCLVLIGAHEAIDKAFDLLTAPAAAASSR